MRVVHESEGSLGGEASRRPAAAHEAPNRVASKRYGTRAGWVRLGWSVPKTVFDLL